MHNQLELPRNSFELVDAMWAVDPHHHRQTHPDLWQRDIAIAETQFPLIANPHDPHGAVQAMTALLDQIAEGKHSQPGRTHFFPIEWFGLFHGMFKGGIIGLPAWSRAARITYAQSGVMSDRGSPTASIEMNDYHLECLRECEPEHMMSTKEFLLWRFMPSPTTLYRGVCSHASDDGWRGLSWTNDPDSAAGYARSRMVIQFHAGHKGGWPRLFKVTAPRSAVLAVLENSVTGSFEVLLDHEKLAPALVEELAPLPPSEMTPTLTAMWAELEAGAVDRQTLSELIH